MQSALICTLVDCMIKSEIYNNYVQEHLAPSGYLKIPTMSIMLCFSQKIFACADIPAYLKGCTFLPQLNNELAASMTQFEHDTVLMPKETSLFGYYPDGSFNAVLPAQQTPLYTEHWIGLKTLDEAGKVKFINVSGGHLDISHTSTQLTTAGSSSCHTWLSSMWNFFKKLAGLNEDQLSLSVVY
ncbi:hypothetical protein ACOSQ2_024339 [Xanthoceras sorbifolium]